MESLKRLYRKPMFQIALIGLVAFADPGLYNTITGMGGAGGINPTVSANGNVALYACGMFSSLFIAPFCYQHLGNVSIFIGGLSYPLYTGSILCYKHTQNGAFVIAAGAILGLGAQMLWIGQGAIMTGYPLESEKGTAIALFWVIFNMGSFIGGMVSFGINFYTTGSVVTDSTYIVFIVLMVICTCLALFIIPRHKMIRTDGSPVAIAHETKLTPKTILIDLLETARLAIRTPKLLAMIPMFFVSNFVYSYQFDAVNGALFNIRTRGLNNALYWGCQMIGSVLLSRLLDSSKIGRRKRTVIAAFIVFIFFNAVWIGGLFSQLQYGIYNAALPADQLLDLTSGPHYGAELVLYMCFGFADSMWQTLIYYLIGTLSNDPTTLARCTGILKLTQCAGALAGWRIDATHVRWLNFLIACWVLVIVAFPGMLWVAWTTEDVTGYDKEIQDAKEHNIQEFISDKEDFKDQAV